MSSLLTEAQEGQVYAGYDSLTAVQFCTPSLLGCRACISASVIDGYIALTVSINTPYGNASKTFQITNNVSFTWQPFSRFKITIGISNFSSSGGFNFDAGIQLCIDVPIMGWKCAGYSYHFTVPAIAATESDLDDNQFSSLLGLHANVKADDCNCDDKSKFLQGGIYSDYLKAQGGFPTVPVVSCITTCTGIPVICASQAAAPLTSNAQAGFPTIPVVSCVVTCTGIPVVCSAAQQAPQAQSENAQAGFPTVPVVSCVVTCTGIPVICAAQAAASTEAAQAGFPTVPVVSCVVTCTGIPVVCAAQQQGVQGTAPLHTSVPTFYPNYCPTQFPHCIPTFLPVHSCPQSAAPQAANTNAAGVQGGFPTVPVVSCVVTCTGIPVVCSAQQQALAAQTGGNLQTGIPTSLPMCFPTLPPQCHPLTGMPRICPSVQQAPLQAAQAQGGFPTVPVVSCITTCTGIPYIC